MKFSILVDCYDTSENPKIVVGPYNVSGYDVSRYGSGTLKINNSTSYTTYAIEVHDTSNYKCTNVAGVGILLSYGGTLSGGGKFYTFKPSSGKSYRANAYFEEIQKYYQYKVTYNDNGGSGGPGVDYTAKKTSPTITYTISSTKPTRTGYTFKGWDLDGNGTADYQPGGSIAVARDITFTAVWEAKSYSITFEKKEGETYSANLNTSKTYGTNYQLPSGGYVSKAEVVNGTYSVICVPANGDNNTILTYTNNTRYVQNG